MSDPERMTQVQMARMIQKLEERVRDLEARAWNKSKPDMMPEGMFEFDALLGFSSEHWRGDRDASMAPMETRTISARPQLNFNGRRVMIPAKIADHFYIHDLRVGNRSTFISCDGVPGEVFATDIELPEHWVTEENGVKRLKVEMKADRMPVDIYMPECYQSGEIYLVVQNVSGVRLAFRGAILGKAHY